MALATALALGSGHAGRGQAAPEAAAAKAVESADRVAGRDEGSGIEYVLLSVRGRVMRAAAQKGDAEGDHAPRLTAQCTRTPDGKLKFELLADAGDVSEMRFVPPWKPRDKSDLFPPRLPTPTFAMEFLGYTKVKPFKRQWVGIEGLPGEWKYLMPGMGSGNLEPASYFLQYLRSLPTLRLAMPAMPGMVPPRTLEWETAKWQAEVKAEPLCRASGL